jgi:hypothetical protein
MPPFRFDNPLFPRPRPISQPDAEPARALRARPAPVTEDEHMIRPAVLALTTVTAAALPGCGTPSDTDQVRSTVSSYLTALAAGDGPKACGQLAPPARRQLSGGFVLRDAVPCEIVVRTVAAHLPDAQRVDLPRIRVKHIIFADRGTKAIIPDEQVVLPASIDDDGNDRPTVLRRDPRGDWKIEDLG